MKQPKKKRVHYPPGSLIYRGKEQSVLATARIVRYNTTDFQEEFFENDTQVFSPLDGYVNWIHVNGIHNVDLIASIGNKFQLHPLLLEDILGTDTLPKQEDFDNCMFASLNAISYNPEIQKQSTSNVSLVLLKNLIISFQEAGPDFNAVIYERIEQAKGVIRTRQPDYLFYRFIDVIVDEYKTVLDIIEDQTENLEEISIMVEGESNVSEIHRLRRQLNKMRRNVNPLKVVVNRLYLEPGPYFQEQTMHFLRDLLDDIEHLEQRIEAARENLLNIMDINYTNLSIKTNEVMRVLTIVATMFIPMTFLAGIYGMNFEHMPELAWKYSYAIFWVLMLAMIIGMLTYFRKQRWI